MTPSAKRKRITVVASLRGVERAENDLTRLGFESKSSFAKAQLMGKSTVDKFFNRQPIQLSSFMRICEGLRIDNWRSIAQLEPVVEQIEHYQPLGEMNAVEAIATPTVEVKPTATRRITVSDEQSKAIKVDIVLEGDINSINDTFSATLETLLRTYSGDTIRIIDIQPGSIRITIQGSPKDVAKLIDRFTSGELTEVNNLPVEAIQILSQDFLEEAEENSSANKWDLIQEIVSHPGQHYQLSGADLSDADLSGADLSDADLSGADLSNAVTRNFVSYLDLALDRVRVRARNFDRASVLARILDSVLDLARVLARDLASDLNIASNLARASDLAYALALGRASARASDLASILNRASDLVSDRDLDHILKLVLVLASDLASDRDLDLDRVSTNFSRTNFSSANFSSANFSRANLSGADLSGANLSGANLSGAIVENAHFGEGIGISESEKRDLRRRGAIFDESPGDREFVLR